MLFDEDPGTRAAIGVSCTRQSGDMTRPGLAFVGSKRGGNPLAGRPRGENMNGVETDLCCGRGRRVSMADSREHGDGERGETHVAPMPSLALLVLLATAVTV
jgi:hypothetical protein